MAIVRWYERPASARPLGLMEQWKREMDRLFTDFTGRTVSSSRSGVFPHLNVSEDSEKLYVSSELPGMEADDVEISVEGDTLTLRGERKLTEAGEGVSYHRREREGGRFRRIVTLPVRIDPNGVEATFKNGVLQIVLPKAGEARARQIKVKTD
jgi:HSP20 family protein